MEGSGGQLFDALVTKTLNSIDILPEHNGYVAKMDFVDTTLLNPSQKFGKISAGRGLANVSETGTKNRRNLANEATKGIYQQEIGEEFANSYLFSQWAKNAKTLSGADSDIQAEFLRIPAQIKSLYSGFDIRYAEELVRVWTLGFAVTAPTGAGSATPKGLALFSASHTISAGGTFSNLVTAGNPYASVTAGIAKLQEALDLHKAAKDENGKKIKQPKVYKLYCSRVKETFWKQVLNNKGNASAIGTNQGVVNQFNFEGNMVELNSLDLIGDTDYSGVAIGTDLMWFVTNPEYIKKAEALKTYRLYEPRIKTIEDQKTDEMITSIRAVVGADHYYAEYGIVGHSGV